MMEDLYWLRSTVHYFLHFVFPFFLAIMFIKSFWRKAYLIMIATMLVDLDGGTRTFDVAATKTFNIAGAHIGNAIIALANAASRRRPNRTAIT